MTEITIAGHSIGPKFPPFVIAELSANHNGELSQALKIIDAAVEAGADAVKIQTYKPDTITFKSDAPDFQITEGLWAGRTLYDLYDWAHTPWEWHKALFSHAAKRGITLFSSPFDPTAVDLLESLAVPAYKIASFEAVDLPLIRYAASKGKPMIISTGMANLEEIGEAVAAAHDGGCHEIALLHCVSGYPAPAADYNLATIADMAGRFGVPVGLSDHTLDNTTAIASVALGASVIEKHMTLDRTGGGPDDSFSLEPGEFATLCRDVRAAWEAVGRVDYGEKSSEAANVRFRRSLYFIKDIKAGETITEDCIRSVRPGYGLAPKHAPSLIGQKITKDVGANTPVTKDAFV
ncbi:pseudaminic acid synthase [Sulfitobacter sp. 1A16808]|uniref:pseudaminic acid synthase n=1 Tax=Sulfitobacter sp. 1A16808 TaxID=3368572 RepID=UPI003746763F